mmetsp:Transcript_36987/g.73202  ORF Transcript_36987/g.73202 Transcript_36987/m.73202 type:complete len:636 (+) Transcript_36987:61-1968(+)
MNRNEAPLNGMRLLLITVILMCCLPEPGAEGAAHFDEPAPGIGSKLNQTRGITASPSLHVEPKRDRLRLWRHQRRSGGVLMLRSAKARRSFVPVPQNVPEVVHVKKSGNRTYPVGSPAYPKQLRLEKFKPEHWNQEAKPVSTTMLCTITLIGTFIVLSAVAKILQTLNYFKILDRKREEKRCGNVEGSVVFVPMLCIVFLAARLQAIQFCRGDLDLFALPTWWVKYAMVIATSAVLLSVLGHIADQIVDEMQDRRVHRRERLNCVRGMIRLCMHVAVGAIYSCFTVVCLGVIFMRPPEYYSKHVVYSYMNPAVTCTIFLSMVYFAVFLSLICVKKANEFGLLGQPLRFCKAQEYLRSTIDTVAAFAPMLCVLFIGTRIRTSQLDPLHGNPEPWVQLLFFLCSGWFVLHTVLALVSTYIEQDQQQGDGTGQYNTGILVSVCAVVVEHLKNLLVVLITAGVLCVIMRYFGNLFFQALFRPWEPTLWCAALLTAIYFIVTALHTMVVTLQKTCPGGAESLPRLEWYIRNARDSLEVCPKFCILYLGTFMRAMQLTDGQGVPNMWCQLSQCVATVCIVIFSFIKGIPWVKNRHTHTVTQTVNVLGCIAYVCAVIQVVFLFWMKPQIPGDVVLYGNSSST